MKIPTPDQELNLKQLLPIVNTALQYICGEALAVQDRNRAEIDYFPDSDEFVYYLKLIPLDREVCEFLTGIEEVWVITKVGEES